MAEPTHHPPLAEVRDKLADLPAGRQARCHKVLFNKKLIMKHCVYALKSTLKNYIYVGITTDLERRISQHNSGKEKTTRFYAPFTLIYTEPCFNRQEARKRERYLKSGAGKEYLKSLL